MVNGATPNVLLHKAPKVIVWDPRPTLKVWVTGGAAVYALLPSWVAVIEQRPAVTTVTVAPATVQTEVVLDVRLTVRPELAVALRPNDVTGNTLSLSGAKVMV